MMDNVALRLGSPRANRPGYFQLLNQVCTQVRTILRHYRNTSNPFNFNDLTITVGANQPTYQINATDFGTPLAVLSYDPGNPSWIARLIPFYQPQNMPFDWGQPQNAAYGFTPYDGSNCTAQRCAFYWRDGNAFIEFQPVPNLTANYRVRYLQNANGVGDMALAQSPLMSEDCDLVEVRAALALLAITEWNAPDKEGRAYNAERRRDLAQTLAAEEAELRRQFEAAALVTTGPRMYNRWDNIVG
jgi:hypothetical protein